MEYTIRDEGRVSVAALKGRLTFAENTAFREMLGRLQKSPAHEWMLDLSGIDFIDSAGLGLLIIIRELAEKGNVSLRLRRPREQAERLFEVAKLNKLFTIEA